MRVSPTTRMTAIVALALGVSGLLVFLPVRDYLYQFLTSIEGLGSLGPALFIAVYVLASLLFVPGSILTLGSGFLFGMVFGTIMVSLASTLGACVAFLLGRTLLRGWAQERVATRPGFRAIDRAIERDGFRVVFLLRLCPVFPFSLLNYSLGVTKVRFRDYFLASWIGMLPATVMYVYLGSTVKNLSDLAAGRVEGGPIHYAMFGVAVVAIATVTVLITRLARRALREAVIAEGAEEPESMAPS